MRTKVGTKAEEFDPAKEEIAAHFKKIDERLDEPDQRGQHGRPEGPGRAERRGPSWKKPSRTFRRSIASFRSEPNKTYISSLDRITELMENLSLLDDRAVAQLRERAEEPRVVHQRRQAAGRRSDQGRRPTARPTCRPNRRSTRKSAGPCLTKVDQLQTDNDKQATEIAEPEPPSSSSRKKTSPASARR